MILYNTTFIIDDARREEFLSYLKETYIPVVTGRGILTQAALHRIISGDREVGTYSYALQFSAQSPEALEQFLSTREMAILQQDMMDRFGSQLNGFITILERQEI